MKGNGSTLLMFVILGAASAVLAQSSNSSIAHASPSPAKLSTPDIPTYDKSKTRAALDGNLASLKTALQMTPQQKELWQAVQVVIRSINRDAYRRHQELAAMPKPASFLEALERIADDNERRAKDLSKFTTAVKPFAASLSDEQRKRLPDFLGMTDNNDESREPTGQRLIFELQAYEADPAK